MKTKNMTTLHLRKSIDRLPWALAVGLTLATLGPGLSVNAQERKTTFITFDAPGAGTGPFEGTAGYAINPAGVIAGQYIDPSGVFHGFVRDKHGAFTTFDPPAAAGLGTAVKGIDPDGAIAGFYLDASNVWHGYVRAPNGTFTTFDAPGAGTGPGQGTFAWTINQIG